ncbi:hypothetical protein RS030_4515 [Cryptosporidium xiaoi]|uniref:Uncharacterized protein n=1 Tax=Cryptosporidium xiaoi TaxID=659607 RepID=A0AAV9XVP9_9CRYT
MLVIREDDYNSLWAELQWPGEKFERVMSYFRKYAGLEEGLSSKRLTKLLLDLGKSCYTVRGGLESLTERGDLCWIISGANIMSGSQFMCLAGLMDNSTPHSTNSPAGLLRLEMIFMYYDKGGKGYWDRNDWELIMKDIQYPSKNGEKLVPYPLKPDQVINFEILKKLVETRRLRGTSQLLRISFDEKDIDTSKDENTNSSLMNNSVNKNKSDCKDINDNIINHFNDNYEIKLDKNSAKVGDNIQTVEYSPNSKKTLRVFSPKKKRQQKSQNETSKNTFTESVSSYMSKIHVIPNSIVNNNSPRMTFRSEVTPSPYFVTGNMNKVSDYGLNVGYHNQLSDNSLLTIQNNQKTPLHLMPSQISSNIDTFGSPVVQNMAGVNDDSNELLNLNSLQNLGQSLQNIGQSLISMIPKVFPVPNITVGAGNYAYVSRVDLKNRLNNNNNSNNNNNNNNSNSNINSNSNNYNNDSSIDPKSEKVYYNSLDNVKDDREKANNINSTHCTRYEGEKYNVFGNISLPNFHSTYSNDNYPMSIDLTKFKYGDSASLPTIPEINEKLNPCSVDNEGEVSLNREMVTGREYIDLYNKNNHVENTNQSELVAKECLYDNVNESGAKGSNSVNKLSSPTKMEEIDYFFTFMEQLLYNEIIENSNVFDKVIEKHDSNFHLTNKEDKYFGKIMAILTMDQLLLTFALSCVISHQNNDYNLNQMQNKGVLGNGVAPSEINDEIDKLLGLFHRIYRIMYQDLKNEMERNHSDDNINDDNDNSVDYTMYDDLPYVVKMVWERIKAALQDDSDKEEIMKDICIVYYHYILETNESFSRKSENGDDKIKYHSIDEMIEIVRRRYVVAMKMLSLNNTAKNNKFTRNLTKNELGRANTKDDKIHVGLNRIEKNNNRHLSSYENVSLSGNLMHIDNNKTSRKMVSKFSPSSKYPLLTATSSPNYSLYKTGVGSLRMIGMGTKKLECDSSRKLFENNANYGLKNDLVPCLSSENLSGDINLTNRESINKHDYIRNGDMIHFNEGTSYPKKYANVNKVQANIASYCPAEHMLTDKIPDARLERKSRIPSRIL